MEYKNESNFGKKVPVVKGSNVSYISFKANEVKDIDLEESLAALHGLSKVEVKAVETSIGKKKVETKVLKTKKVRKIKTKK